MLPQVIALFENQYEVNFEEFQKLFLNFYEHDFQKNKCIRIVALEGETVIGFQSFFYWPYLMDGVELNTYQSGNSLVHPNHRGKGVFRKLLTYFEEIKDHYRVEFLIGFPVEASKNSFIRNDWNNILDLVWYIKIGSVLSFFSNEKKQESKLNSDVLIANASMSYELSQSKEFINWRKSLPNSNEKFKIVYSRNDMEVVYECKLQKRMRIIKECVVGGVTTNSNDLEFHEEGINYLVKTIRRRKLSILISIAVNEMSKSNILKALETNKFKKTKKKIYFIVKNFSNSIEPLTPSNWELYRRDIDTW
jgi:GNAT superfamily N-acetyltransferase